MGNRSVELEGARWLALLLQGVRRSDLGPDNAPELHRHVVTRAPCTLELPTGVSATDRFFHALPLTDLRDQGPWLDRRSYFARPAWQSDRAVVDQLAKRPQGSADSVVLWLRDAGRAAMLGGLRSTGHRQAIRDLDAQVSRVLQRMAKDGEPPNVLALTLDPLAPVSRSFDLGRVLARELPRRLIARLGLVEQTSYAKLRCASVRDLATTAARLTRPPFANHGTLLTPEELAALRYPWRQDELVFVAHEQVAFARGMLRAAPRLLATESSMQSTVTLPWRHETSTQTRASMSIDALAAQFATRVASQLRPTKHPTTDVAAAVADYPDLLSIMDPEVAKILGTLA